MSEKTIEELKAELAEAQNELARIKVRSLKVYEENQLLQNSDEYAKQAGEMKYLLEMAKSFIKSGAFPSSTPEQLYVKIKAGREMGMGEMEAVNSLYFVNGKLEPYGKGMIALLTSRGYRLTYENETDTGVTVVAISPEGFEHRERASTNDPLIQRSKAAKISLKNKLRFHAVRTLLNFQLPHLIRGAADLFEAEYFTEEGNTAIQSDDKIIELLKGAKSFEELDSILAEYDSQISKDIVLLGVLQKVKKDLANE